MVFGITSPAFRVATPADPPMQRYSHDIPMAELDGQHAKSVDCPCGTDVEHVTPTSAIVYHQRRTGPPS